MIHPFAIQPEVIVDWAFNRRDTAQAVDTIGIGKPRFLLRLPKDLRKKCYEALLERPEDDFASQRLTALMEKICENAINRPDQKSDKGKDWLSNAKDEYEHQTFRAIIANEVDGDHVVNSETIFEEPNELWTLKSSQSILRQAPAIAAALKPLLREGLHCYLVDPYFSPEKGRYIKVIRALAAEGPTDRGMEISIRCREDSTLNYFNEKAAEMAKDLPTTCTVSFKRLPSDSMHDRFFLTKVGGLFSSNGFEHYDRTKKTMHVSILSPDQYSEVWNEYAQSDNSRVVDTPKSVVGQKTL